MMRSTITGISLFVAAACYFVSPASAFQGCPGLAPAAASQLVEAAMDQRMEELAGNGLSATDWQQLDPALQRDIAPLYLPNRRDEFQLPHYYNRDARRVRKVA